MASPTVFVSSTWYDLRYIRSNLGFFIRTLGYTAVLSEEGSIYYDPAQHVQDAAIAEVEHSHLFVLIIGGRFGTELHDSSESVTNAEYEAAVRHKVPVFALVEAGTHADYELFRANEGADLSGIVFPHADDPRIFEFIRQVQSQAVNNALVPFGDFSDIESYLRQQWAGMMHSFVTGEQQAQRVADTLAAVRQVSERVEVLADLILDSVGSPAAKAAAALYDRMLRSEAVRSLSYMRVPPTPRAILEAPGFQECAAALGRDLEVDDRPEEAISPSGTITESKLARDSEDYERLKHDLALIIDEYAVKLEDLPLEPPASVGPRAHDEA